MKYLKMKTSEGSLNAIIDNIERQVGIYIYKSKYKKVGGVLPIRIVKSNVSSIGPSSERMLETLDYNIHIGSTPTFLFRFVSLLCQRSTRLGIYIYIYIYFSACHHGEAQNILRLKLQMLENF